MSTSDRRLILLGPQPEYQSLKAALSRLGNVESVALITAGWETDEDQDQAVVESIGTHVLKLNLFARSEQLFADDPELIQQLQVRQDELRQLRDVYKLRLNHLLAAARELIGGQNSLVDLSEEKESAIEMVRQLDRQYLIRTRQICDRYEELLQIKTRPTVEKQCQEIAQVLRQSDAIVISGGHVAIILNRLRIFRILQSSPAIPIIAWSGGTMALANQVVFFHDSPPQGPGDAEVLRPGVGLYSDILPLPDAKSRLHLNDAPRVELFARRFEVFKCVVFDESTILDRQNGIWSFDGQVNRLTKTGSIAEFEG